jgi:hypothetical protein
MKLIDPETYPIKPESINVRQHFFNAFGNYQTEVSAGWIVRFCQQRGVGWLPFAFADINQFYLANVQGDNRSPEDRQFGFNELDDRGFLVFQDDRYHFTHEFIARCHLVSPVL